MQKYAHIIKGTVMSTYTYL